MRILFNATSIHQGGGVRRATECIRHLSDDDHGHDWTFALSEPVSRDCKGLESKWPSWIVFEERPSRSASVRRQLAELEGGVSPDCVVTFAGPAYCDFLAPHLMGWADGWTSHPNRHAYASLRSPIKKLTTYLTSRYKARWIRRADLWFVQTECARQGLHQRCGLPLDRIEIIPNTCGDLYFRANEIAKPRDARSITTIFVFAAPWPHKRLEIIPLVARELKRHALLTDFEFLLTLPETSDVWLAIQKAARKLAVESHIRNMGPVPSRSGPSLYAETDVCFLPSVLETFSGVYPEAMAMGRPIVTSDLDFAHDVCKDAAEYFEANNPLAAATALQRVVHDGARRLELITSGRRVLSKLPNTGDQVNQLVRIVESLVTEQLQIPGFNRRHANGAEKSSLTL